jgi:hypothetical protein
VEPEDNVETAAQVRAIAAAKVSKGVAAREAERRTRKAKRAGVRIDAAVQHIISPDSVEGLFQAMAFLRKQVRICGLYYSGIACVLPSCALLFIPFSLRIVHLFGYIPLCFFYMTCSPHPP